MEPKKFKSYLGLIAFTVILLFVMLNFGVVWGLLGLVINVVMPFFVGFIIAYLINMPYVFFADKAYKGLDNRGRFLKKMRKPLALVTAYIIVFGVIAFLVVILIPQLTDSVNQLVKNFSGYAQSFQQFLTDFLGNNFGIKLDNDSDIMNFINSLVKTVTGGELNTLLKNLASSIAPSVFDITKNFTTSVINLGMGIIVSVYFMGCKDKLIFQTKKLCYAYLPKRIVPKVMEIGDLSNNIFGKFVYGKILDSLIIGVLCFIVMSICGFDYPPLISVIIGVTNVIPVFGPFIGAIPSIFIMLMIDPIESRLVHRLYPDSPADRRQPDRPQDFRQLHRHFRLLDYGERYHRRRPVRLLWYAACRTAVLHVLCFARQGGQPPSCKERARAGIFRPAEYRYHSAKNAQGPAL